MVLSLRFYIILHFPQNYNYSNIIFETFLIYQTVMQTLTAVSVFCGFVAFPLYIESLSQQRISKLNASLKSDSRNNSLNQMRYDQEVAWRNELLYEHDLQKKK